jgi:hypothetical protein
MTHLNSELSLERLDTVSGGGGIFGASFIPSILSTKEQKPSNPAPTTSSGSGSELNLNNTVSTGGIKSAPFNPVTIRF